MDMEGMWFQQDGATCHTARETTVLLRENFRGRVISRNGDQNWPPRSCDLTPCHFFLWSLWNLVSMPTNHKQFLSSRWRFDVSLAKLSRNYAETSSRVSSEEQECASRVVGDICQISCSTINRSECTLYWNKNISTFWINSAFYYKIKSCALVGTPHTTSAATTSATTITTSTTTTTSSATTTTTTTSSATTTSAATNTTSATTTAAAAAAATTTTTANSATTTTTTTTTTFATTTTTTTTNSAATTSTTSAATVSTTTTNSGTTTTTTTAAAAAVTAEPSGLR